MRARLTVEAGECSPTALDIVPDQPVTLGRSRDNTLIVRDERASRLHAKIYCEDSQWFLRDFGLNGTRVDGSVVNGSVQLKDRAEIDIGDVTLRFRSAISDSVKPPPSTVIGAVTLHGSTVMKAANRPTPPKVANNAHQQTKVHEMPAARQTGEAADDSRLLRVDELTALCKFMTQAVETPDAHALISLALRSILNQTTAKLAGYLSFNPDDPTPKLVMPDTAAVDAPLSKKLTLKAQRTGKTVWLFASQGDVSSTDSLSSFTDALCLPLKIGGEAFAALHVYRTGVAFMERDVRFIEAVAGHLAHGLEIHRNRRTLEAENSRLRTHVPAADEIIGSSNGIIHLRQQILRAAPQTINVLIHGESGAGKELVALALHRHSKRTSGPLVVVNCAAIAPTMLDAELFGYKKGAFHGADRDHPGLFQQADEGTLFLDEVAELSPECQAKVLRFIEGKAFRPVGATADVKVDARVIASTHRDLEKEVTAGRFRQDLFFRLKVISIRVPPLREHAEDVTELAQFFLAKVSAECRRTFKLTPGAMQKLQSYAWPGNVRQLRAVLESAAVMSDSDVLESDVLPLSGDSSSTTAANQLEVPASLDMEDIETWAILRALKQTGGNVSHAAKLLGMSRDTLHTKIKKKCIDRDALVSTPEPAASTESSSDSGRLHP